MTGTLTSLVPPPHGVSDQNHYEPHYGAAKAIDGNLLTKFRTNTIPSGIILTLAQSMMIRRVRVFTGPKVSMTFLVQFINRNSVKLISLALLFMYSRK